MIRLLNRLRNSFRSSPPEGYPLTYLTPGDGRRDIFDPSLKHYPNAFRSGEPAFRSMHEHKQWHAARTAIMVHALGLIASSPWRDHLVLRGSSLLKTWFKTQARPPGGMDWVVYPAEIRSSSRKAKALLDGIAALIAANRTRGRIKIDRQRMARDRIWTDERADGIRLAFPWGVPGLPEGVLHMDFVFGETLWEPPITTRVALSSNSPEVALPTATPALSLAWKLMWLENDAHPQGKDLYDATLLAEYVRLSPELLDKVMRHGPKPERYLRHGIDPHRWPIDWRNFQQEHPHVIGSQASWTKRLIAAIGLPCSVNPPPTMLQR